MSEHERLRVIATRWAKTLKYRNGSRYGFGCSVIASECVTSAGDIPDVIGWRMGYSYLIECKASRSDFFADRNKPQRNNGTGMGNYRYYFTPKGLIAAEELPDGWGMIEVEGKESQVSVECKMRQIDAIGHCDEKRILLSLIRRIKQREFLILQDERESVANED